MPFIDTHCHLDFDVFDHDRASLVQRCRDKELTQFILPGVTKRGWQKLISLGDEFTEIYTAPGLHPCFMAEHQHSHLEDLQALFDHENKNIVAIGEVGLDYFVKPVDRQRQVLFFEEQVKVAAGRDLPLLLHVRKAHDEVLQVIRRLNFKCGGIVHCYSGSLQQGQRYVDNGFKLGIGGVITYENAHRLQNIVRSLPLSAFVLETDAPDIPPAGFQDQINTPENLPEICRAFSQFREESYEKIVDTLYQNTLELFPQLEH